MNMFKTPKTQAAAWKLFSPNAYQSLIFFSCIPLKIRTGAWKHPFIRMHETLYKEPELVPIATEKHRGIKFQKECVKERTVLGATGTTKQYFNKLLTPNPSFLVVWSSSEADVNVVVGAQSQLQSGWGAAGCGSKPPPYRLSIDFAPLIAVDGKAKSPVI